MDKFIDCIGIFICSLIVIFFAALLVAWPIQLLWNWLMPIIFALPALTFLQSWGLGILAGFLTRGNSSNAWDTITKLMNPDNQKL